MACTPCSESDDTGWLTFVSSVRTCCANCSNAGLSTAGAAFIVYSEADSVFNVSLLLMTCSFSLSNSCCTASRPGTCPSAICSEAISAD
ncbi:Uncharacterised protein [Serratia fonticola]|uniref:Uncharacterized protein n=1 Tax=Serratia fonticola TaxID=47917 RepID=A0A4U9UUE8_SERFO|nr:Uncharacterised protein [Serratia fonticola]